MANFKDQYLDPRWQKKRLEVFDRDNWTCQACGIDFFELHVHHLEYGDGKIWDVDNSKLITLCKYCHSFLEMVDDRPMTNTHILQISNSPDCGELRRYFFGFNNGVIYIDGGVGFLKLDDASLGIAKAILRKLKKSSGRVDKTS